MDETRMMSSQAHNGQLFSFSSLACLSSNCSRTMTQRRLPDRVLSLVRSGQFEADEKLFSRPKRTKSVVDRPRVHRRSLYSVWLRRGLLRENTEGTSVTVGTQHTDGHLLHPRFSRLCVCSGESRQRRKARDVHETDNEMLCTGD